MDVGEFFSSGDHWAQRWVVDVALIESLRFGALADRTDLEVAIALTKLLYEDFVSYGTDGTGRRLNDESVVPVIKAHGAVLERLAPGSAAVAVSDLRRPARLRHLLAQERHVRRGRLAGAAGVRRGASSAPPVTPWKSGRSWSTRAASRRARRAASRT